jgi:hypothetical protein
MNASGATDILISMEDCVHLQIVAQASLPVDDARSATKQMPDHSERLHSGAKG